MRKLALFIVTAVFLGSCAQASSELSGTGRTLGVAFQGKKPNTAALGEATGRLLGRALEGKSEEEIASAVVKEAAIKNQPVEYSGAGERWYAEPLVTEGNCQLVKLVYYKNGKLTRLEQREVCL